MKSLREVMVQALCLIVFYGCANSTHKTIQSQLGRPVSSSEMEALLDRPGPIDLSTIKSADWVASLDGLLNLKHHKAKNAGLKNKDEPIQLYTYFIRHPSFGLFLVDTGMSKKFAHEPSSVGVSWPVQKGMGLKKMIYRQGTAEALSLEKSPLKGVFMTHLHIDHIAGMPDIPNDVPIYAGPKEVSDKHWFNFAVQGTTDRLLKGKKPIQLFQFEQDKDGKFDGIIDLFGDGSVFAISSPGHSAGSVAYIARTTSGPVLMTGDTCITRWGWENGVEPGDFTVYQDHNRKSLLALKALAERHPKMMIRLGHQ